MRFLALIVLSVTACSSENDLDGFVDPNDAPGDTADTAIDFPDVDTDSEEDTEGDTDTDVDTVPDTDTDTVPQGDCGFPVANAGPDRVVSPLSNILLSGASSFDPSGCTPLTYSWRLVSSPSGSNVFIFLPFLRDQSHQMDVAGTYEFELTATNSAGNQDMDTVVITSEPTQDFYVQLTWNTDADLDMHVLDGTSTLFDSPYDMNYCNTIGEWGGPGTADNGSLDWDDIDGRGPETMTIQTPAPGTYDIKVHYYGLDGRPNCGLSFCPSSVATIKIFNQGTLLQTFTQTLPEREDLWNVATVSWPGLVITEVNTLTTTPLNTCF